MRIVRPREDGTFLPFPDPSPEFWIRLAFLEALFRPGHQEGSPADILRSLLPRPVSFAWFDDCYDGAYYERPEPSVSDCFAPAEILECVRAVLETLRSRAEELPWFYYLRDERTGEGSSGIVVYEGREYQILSGWARCEARPWKPDATIASAPGDRNIDLSGMGNIHCRQIFPFGGIARGRVGQVLGPETTLLIERESCADRFGPPLNDIIALASKAEAADALVFSHLA